MSAIGVRDGVGWGWWGWWWLGGGSGRQEIGKIDIEDIKTCQN